MKSSLSSQVPQGRFRVSFQEAFTLVEICLALGIMSFALLGIFGLIPVGLNTFHNSRNVTVASRIQEKIFADLKGVTFDNLTNSSRFGGASSSPLALTTRYFDEEGEEVAAGDSKVLYWANVRVVPATAPVVKVAKGDPDPVTNPDLATVTIQVAYNPSNIDLNASPNATMLWKPTNSGGVTLYTFSSYIARNL